ncbi:hypothetical protein EHQ58_01345 [Leptospira ognonensis]|uniref:Uncharacterized protein n=1 Tax=Leptospira ognonensis TaxID=2484945 RepID=A0A4R9KD90_9LEPT|nr:hypothetical protein [Leptospira ognonensis]TGL63122.1 hypothetical protein EHQ58_01345 [Leptospira ognonensis]
MLSIEKKNQTTESSIAPFPFLHKKIEQHASKLIESMSLLEQPDPTSWAVVDFKGKILFSGASRDVSEKSEFLF